MAERKTTAVILAAGLGTRMKSLLPKAMHPLGGVPLIKLLIHKTEQVFDRIVVVAGPDMPALTACVAPHIVVIQHERLGTGHAARQAEAHFGDGDVAVLYADNPLISTGLMRELLQKVTRPDCLLAMLAMRPLDAGRYGRVIMKNDTVQRVVEWKDASESERSLTLCNAGVICGAASNMKRWLQGLTNQNAQGEFYLTDVIEAAAREGHVHFVEGAETELAGINTRAELAAAERAFQNQMREAAMENGVTLVAPETVFFSFDTDIAQDCVIEPQVIFGPGVKLASGVHVRAFSHLEGCEIGKDACIGPYARIRPGTYCAERAHVGNFVELKATRLGAGSKVNHLSYIGDAEVGGQTNIGAGTITCNYDGVFKHRSKIGDRAFIGSNTLMVAPISVGNDTLVAAGSVLTADVPDKALAVARAYQTVKPGRGKEMQDLLKSKKEKC